MFRSIRGLVYTLFGGLVLTTLWVSSLCVLSARASATTVLADAGAQVLNPYLVRLGVGLTESTYQDLEAAAHAHPAQPLALPSPLTVTVLGREIGGKSYADAVVVVYRHVAEVYYDKGASAVFAIPPELQSVLPNFGLFNANNIPILQGGPTPAQLPDFLKPFFLFTGLTPNTFTAAGHADLLHLLPWFWLATAVLGVLAVVLNPSETKLEGLAHGLVHGTWPVVLVLGGATLLASAQAARFGAYRGVLAEVDGAFLPIYGAGLAVGLIGLALTVVLPALRKGGAAQGDAAIPAGVGAGEASPRMAAERRLEAGVRPNAGSSASPGAMEPPRA